MKKSEAQENARSAAKATGQFAGDAAERAVAGVEQIGRNTREMSRDASEAGGETLRHIGRSAAQATAQASERIADAGQDYYTRLAAQFEQALDGFVDTMESSARDWRALFDIGAASRGGYQHAQRGIAHGFENAMRANLRATEELFRMAGPLAIASMQQRIFRNYLSAALDSSASVMRGVQQSTEHSLRPLEERLTELDEYRRESPRVADVMQRDVQVINHEDTVQHAARMMAESDTGTLPVRDGDRIVGMVTDRDVALRLVAKGKDPARTKVREVMTSQVRYVFEDEEIGHVVDNMAEQQVRRLPVMNREKRLVGVVSLGDIAKAGQAPSAGQALAGVTRRGGQHSQAAE